MDLAFRRAVEEARRHGDLYFASLLPAEHIHRAFGKARWFWQGWISFKGALQTMSNFLPMLITSITTEDWCTTLLNAIATHRVGDRPDRIEPRERKRRPKNYKFMVEPRQTFKKRVA